MKRKGYLKFNPPGGKPFVVVAEEAETDDVASLIRDSLVIAVECHSEETLFKVDAALESCGWSLDERREAINAMQNAGILFRERV